MTSAPFAAAYRIALTASAAEPSPFEPMNFRPITRTRWLTPVTPTPLSPTPTVPATCVPWPWSSAGSLSSFAKSQPRQSST